MTTRTLRTTLVLAALLGSSSACVGGEDQRPIAALRAFEDAVASGDRASLRRLVAASARPYVSAIPRRRSAHRLEVLGKRREAGRLIVEVRDPSPEAVAPEGSFVLVQEDGEWLVDLLETAGRNSRQAASLPPRLRLRQARRSRGPR